MESDGQSNSALLDLPGNTIALVTDGLASTANSLGLTGTANTISVGGGAVSSVLLATANFDVNYLNNTITAGKDQGIEFNNSLNLLNEAIGNYNQANGTSIPAAEALTPEQFAQMDNLGFRWMSADKDPTVKPGANSGGHSILNGINGNNNMMLGNTLTVIIDNNTQAVTLEPTNINNQGIGSTINTSGNFIARRWFSIKCFGYIDSCIQCCCYES